MMNFKKILSFSLLCLGLTAAHAKPTYTDFSGHWQGSCDDGASFELELSNDLTHLCIEKERHKIGSLNQFVEDTPEYARILKSIFTWKNHFTMLEGHSQSTETRRQSQVLNPPITTLIYQSIRMQDQDLIYILQEDGASRRCVLQKT